MQISTGTVQIIKNFSNIEDFMRITPGDTIYISKVDGSFYAEAKLKESFPKEIRLPMVKQFCTILSKFSEPFLHINDNDLVITDMNRSNKLKSKIMFSYIKDDNGPLKIEKNVKFSFNISQDNIETLFSLSSAQGLDTLSISKNGDEYNISGVSSDDKTANEVSYSLKSTEIIEDNSTNDFSLSYDIRQLDKILKADYELCVLQNDILLLTATKIPKEIVESLFYVLPNKEE